MDSTSERVTVIGLGLLGSAIAQTFVGGGYEVTIWNRSPGRTEAFGDTATIAPSVAAACEASDVVVICLIDPAASRAVLRHRATEAAIEGKLLVQLTTSTPTDARDEAQWASRCGARYLGGAILASPATVGTERAKAFFSGPKEVFDRYRPWLQALAPSAVYYGEEIGRAATMDHALLELTYGCLAVLFHSLALCEAGSIPHDEFFDQVTLFPRAFLDQAAGALASGTYPSGTATMNTFVSWAEQLVQTSEDAGVDTMVPTSLLHGISKAVRLGHGDDDYQALYEAFRCPSE